MKKVILVAVVAILAIVGGLIIFNSLKPVTQIDNYPDEFVEKKGLVVESLKENDAVSSTLQITGYINEGGWTGFEGQVGTVSLYDSVNNLLNTQPLSTVKHIKLT